MTGLSWMLLFVGCGSEEPEDSGAVDTAETASPEEDGERYYEMVYDGEAIVKATLFEEATEEGGRRVWGTTWYDYTLSLEYVATLTEEFILDADDQLVAADIQAVTNLGTAIYEDRATLEGDILRITRPGGSLTWAFEAEHPVFLYTLSSDGFFGFNQATPAAAQVGIYIARASEWMSLVSHEYTAVYDLPGGESNSYALGRDTIRAQDDGSLGRIFVGDAGGLAMKEVDGPFELDPAVVEHGEEDVGFPDCSLLGMEENFVVESLDGFSIHGTALWPEGWEAQGRAITFNAGTGGSDRYFTAGGIRRWECLARPYLEAGVAVIRYDDRAHGESDGEFVDLTFTARTWDALAVAEWVVAQSDVQLLYLLGHSEGGAHVSEVAAQLDVAGLVFFAVVGDMSGLDLWIGQGEQWLREHGFDEGYISTVTEQREDVSGQIVNGTWTAETYGSLPTEFWRDFFLMNGADLALAADTPAFVAQGDLDWQVVEENGTSLHAALEAAGNDSTYYGVSPAGHFLNRAPGDFPMSGDEYWLPLSWDESMVAASVDWVLAH